MSWISPESVLGRVLLSLGIALFLGGLTGSLLGVKTSVALQGEEALPPNGALVVSAYTLTSSGTIRVEVWNASEAYYVGGIRGDPRSLLKGLQTFNITSGNENFHTDLRLGIVYGVSEVRASHGLLAALPGVSQALRFNIHRLQSQGKGHYVLEKKLGVNEAIMLFAVGENVRYTFTYSVGEKHMVSPGRLSLAGAGLSLLGLAVLWPRLGAQARAGRAP